MGESRRWHAAREGPDGDDGSSGLVRSPIGPHRQLVQMTCKFAGDISGVREDAVHKFVLQLLI